MKRFVLLTVLILMLFSFAACSYDPNAVEEDKLPENYTASPEGYDYTILSDLSSMKSLCNLSEDSELSDKLRAHYEKIENDLGCTINLEITSDAIENGVFRSASGKSMAADLIESDAATVKRLTDGGYVTALEDIPGISADDEKFGLDSQKKYLAKDGKTYGIFPLYLGVSAPTYSYVLYYNDGIVSKYSSLSPDILSEQGKWNRENFLKIAKDVTVAEGDNKTYAFITPDVSFPDFIDAAFLSEGITPLKKNADGSVSCGYEKYKTLKTLDWITDLVTTSRVTLGVSGTDADIYAFAEGKTAFLVSSARTGFSLASDFPQTLLGENMRFASFPSDSRNSVSAFGKNDTFYAVMTKGKKKIADSAEILDRLFSPMEGDDSDTWKTRLSEMYFYNENDFSSYILSLSSAVDSGFFEISDCADAVREAWTLVIKGNKSAAQAQEEVENVINGLY